MRPSDEKHLLFFICLSRQVCAPQRAQLEACHEVAPVEVSERRVYAAAARIGHVAAA